nr:unnamed protein product [Digitaria exilis]
MSLGDNDLKPTPTCTLRHLIQSWCAAHIIERCGGGGNDGGDRGKRAGKLPTVAIEHLCGCVEGRQELVAHQAGMVTVPKATDGH